MSIEKIKNEVYSDDYNLFEVVDKINEVIEEINKLLLKE